MLKNLNTENRPLCDAAQSYSVSGTNVTYGYTYDSENRLTAETMSGYTLTAYQYDAQGQLVRCTDAVSGFSFTYAYDSRGNITLLKCYQSTAADLTGITPIYQRSFSYQTSGWTDELTQTHMSVKGSDNNLYDYEYNSVLYDDIGNVTSYGNKSFTWENGRKLTSVTEGNNTYSYTYDEEGMRVSKTVGNTTTRFNYSGGQLLSQSDGTNTLIFQYDTSGNPAGFLLNGTQYFYVTDPQGNVTMLTDAQGNWVASYMYRGDAYGGSVFINSSGNGGNAAQLNPIRYKGYYYDAETGFYYLQSRYYDPSICRFINADTYCDTGTGTTLSTNMFAYCENDPVNNVDVFGKKVTANNNCKTYNTKKVIKINKKNYYIVYPINNEDFIKDGKWKLISERTINYSVDLVGLMNNINGGAHIIDTSVMFLSALANSINKTKYLVYAKGNQAIILYYSTSDKRNFSKFSTGEFENMELFMNHVGEINNFEYEVEQAYIRKYGKKSGYKHLTIFISSDLNHKKNYRGSAIISVNSDNRIIYRPVIFKNDAIKIMGRQWNFGKWVFVAKITLKTQVLTNQKLSKIQELFNK